MSQCADILAFLSDGRPHEMRSIHRAVGFCRLNSRVAELRKQGHRIECEKTHGLYIYTLVEAAPSEPKDNPNNTETAVTSPGGLGTAVRERQDFGSLAADEQLTLVAA